MNGEPGVSYPTDAWELLSPALTEMRRTKLVQAAKHRTTMLRLVIQDTHHPHNVSACLRSAEAFGIQNIDVVNLKENFKVSTVAKGVHHWLHIKKYDHIAKCANALKADGYVLAAGYPRPDVHLLEDLPIDRPMALVFGNEHAGVHDAWKPHLDYAFQIPMYGFVESLNISVSCAISLHTLSERYRKHYGEAFYLPQAAQSALLNEWICHQVASYQGQLARLRTSTL